MRYTIFLSFFLLFILSCNNHKADQPIAANTTVAADTAIGTVEGNHYWKSTLNDSTGKLEMKKIATTDSLTPQSALSFINNAYPRIRLEWVKTSNDTVYLKIQDATVLTQQMGSTGAMEYMAAAVYNLTELAGIKYVNLDFEEGDHASPGTFIREDFKDE